MTSKLPLSVLVALGLASCGACGPGDDSDPRPCLSIAPDPDLLGPCLKVDEGPPPEESIPELEQAVCLSELPDAEPEPEPEPPADVCLSIAPPPDPDPPLRPCLSIRPPVPPPIPEPQPTQDEDGSGDASTEGQDERVAVMAGLEDRLPTDVLERL